MKQYKLVGKEVKCHFWDHSEDFWTGHDYQSVECIVYGQVIQEDARQIVVRSWQCSNVPQEVSPHNDKVFCVVKGAIIALYVYPQPKKTKV